MAEIKKKKAKPQSKQEAPKDNPKSATDEKLVSSIENLAAVVSTLAEHTADMRQVFMNYNTTMQNNAKDKEASAKRKQADAEADLEHKNKMRQMREDSAQAKAADEAKKREDEAKTRAVDAEIKNTRLANAKLDATLKGERLKHETARRERQAQREAARDEKQAKQDAADEKQAHEDSWKENSMVKGYGKVQAESSNPMAASGVSMLTGGLINPVIAQALGLDKALMAAGRHVGKKVLRKKPKDDEETATVQSQEETVSGEKAESSEGGTPSEKGKVDKKAEPSFGDKFKSFFGFKPKENEKESKAKQAGSGSNKTSSSTQRTPEETNTGILRNIYNWMRGKKDKDGKDGKVDKDKEGKESGGGLGGLLGGLKGGLSGLLGMGVMLLKGAAIFAGIMVAVGYVRKYLPEILAIWEKIKKFSLSTWDAIKAVWDGLKNSVDAIVGFGEMIGEGMGNAWNAIVEKLNMLPGVNLPTVDTQKTRDQEKAELTRTNSGLQTTNNFLTNHGDTSMQDSNMTYYSTENIGSNPLGDLGYTERPTTNGASDIVNGTTYKQTPVNWQKYLTTQNESHLNNYSTIPTEEGASGAVVDNTQTMSPVPIDKGYKDNGLDTMSTPISLSEDTIRQLRGEKLAEDQFVQQLQTLSEVTNNNVSQPTIIYQAPPEQPRTPSVYGGGDCQKSLIK